MYNLVKSLSTRKELLRRKIKVFTNQQFASIFNLSPYQTEYELHQLISEGLLTRLKKGLYILKTDSPSEEEIANILYKPSYISFEYALAYYNIIPEMVYQITSATTKPTRLFTVEHNSFSYYTIKLEAYTGYTLVKRGESRFYIAEPEKALVDYLYVISLGLRSLSGGVSINDRIELGFLNKDKILVFAKLYNRPSLDRLIKEELWFQKSL